MNLEENDIIKLSDNISYLVVSKIYYKNSIYLYLIDSNNNVKFVSLYENTVREVTDNGILCELLKLIVYKNHI